MIKELSQESGLVLELKCGWNQINSCQIEILVHWEAGIWFLFHAICNF